MTQELVSASDAVALNEAIESEAKAAAHGEITLNRTYSRLAALLANLKRTEAWRLLSDEKNPNGFPSYNRYLISLVVKSGRSVQQLYAYTAVAEALLPAVGEIGLEIIGVSRASELAKASKKAGKPVTQELIDAAMKDENGINEIRALAHLTYNLPDEKYPKGTWFDLGGFYATEEFRKLFHSAYEVTVRVLELPKEMPSWVKMMRVQEAWAQSAYAEYAPEVYGKTTEAAEPANG